MSNQLMQLPNESSIELLPPARPASLEAKAMLLQHAEMMQTAYDLACKMVGTSMVPKRFFRKEEDATAAILYGAELGLTPIQSLQRVIAIHGMPSLEARTMVALLKPRGYKVRTVDQSDESVTVIGRDLDGDEYQSTWTIERAHRAGYVPTPSSDDSLRRPDVEDDWVTVTKVWDGKAKKSIVGNMKYITDPQAMLKAKAQAEVCREMAPDVLIGISYSAEELESERWDSEPQRAPERRQQAMPITVEEILGDPEPAQQPAAEQPAPKAQPNPERAQAVADAQAKIDTESQPETPQESEPNAAGPHVPQQKPMAEATRKKWMNRMFMLFKEADCGDRQDQLIVLRAIADDRDGVFVEVEHRDQLSDDELRTAVNTLNEWQKAGTLGDQITEVLQAYVAALADEETTAGETAEGENSTSPTDQEG